MKHSLFSHSKIYIAVFVFLAAAACGLGEPGMEGIYSSVQYNQDAGTCLIDAVGSAKISIRLALHTFSGTGELIDLLNDKTEDGITNQIVISAANAGTASALNVSAKSGNAGNMYSNFAIIDDEFVVFFSDCALSEPSAIAVTVRHKDLIRALNIEFRQMFEKAQFGANKQSLVNPDTQIVFRTFSGFIDMYLLPRAEDYGNDVIGFICERVRQAQRSVDVYAGKFGNPVLNDTFKVAAASDLETGFYSGSATGNLSLAVTVLPDPFFCNAIVIDSGTPRVTAIITTFPFVNSGALNEGDGVALFIRGKAAEQIGARMKDLVPDD